MRSAPSGPAYLTASGLRHRLWLDGGITSRKARCDGIRLDAGVGRGVLGKRERHVVAVVAHLRYRLPKPAVDGTVHQQIAEGEHEGNGQKAHQHGAPEHPRAQTRSQDAAALVRIEL